MVKVVWPNYTIPYFKFKLHLKRKWIFDHLTDTSKELECFQMEFFKWTSEIINPIKLQKGTHNAVFQMYRYAGKFGRKWIWISVGLFAVDVVDLLEESIHCTCCCWWSQWPSKSRDALARFNRKLSTTTTRTFSCRRTFPTSPNLNWNNKLTGYWSIIGWSMLILLIKWSLDAIQCRLREGSLRCINRSTDRKISPSS